MNDSPDVELIEAIRDDALRGIHALKRRPPPADAPEVDRRVWALDVAVEAAGLDRCVFATRPVDDAARDVDFEWLLGLAAALAERWRVRPGEHAALSAYAAEHGTDRDGGKAHLLMRAVLIAQAARDAPTTVRIARNWITDDDGRKLPVKPHSTLEYFTFLRWFVGRSLREARRLLREYSDGVHTDARVQSLEETAGLGSDRSDPLTDLLLAEAAAETRAEVDALYNAARDDTDRALLDGRARGESIAETADKVGLSTEAAKKRIQRLRARRQAG